MADQALADVNYGQRWLAGVAPLVMGLVLVLAGVTVPVLLVFGLALVVFGLFLGSRQIVGVRVGPEDVMIRRPLSARRVPTGDITTVDTAYLVTGGAASVTARSAVWRIAWAHDGVEGEAVLPGVDRQATAAVVAAIAHVAPQADVSRFAPGQPAADAVAEMRALLRLKPPDPPAAPGWYPDPLGTTVADISDAAPSGAAKAAERYFDGRIWHRRTR